jgi:hypothetical protein
MVKPDLALEVPDLSGRFAVVTGADLKHLGVLHPKEQ